MKLRMIMIMLSIIAVGFLSFFCNTNITSQCDNNDLAKPDSIITFSYLQSNLMTPTCAISGCHSDKDRAGDLNLRSGLAYANLVNINSTNYPGKVRVVPGDKNNSILYQQLDTKRMPRSGVLLDQTIIDQVGKWIDQGAIDN